MNQAEMLLADYLGPMVGHHFSLGLGLDPQQTSIWLPGLTCLCIALPCLLSSWSKHLTWEYWQ